VSETRVVYKSRPDATPESEAQALAAVYRFVLDCHAKKKAGVRRAGDDGKENLHDPAKPILPRR
jgi:hypothetical protein